MFKSVKRRKIHRTKMKCGRVVTVTQHSVQTDKSSVNEDSDVNRSALIEPVVDVVHCSQNKADWKSMEEGLVPAVGTIRGKLLRRMEVFSKMVCEYGRSRFG